MAEENDSPDIVERLRNFADKSAAHSVGELWNGLDEAADEIERLREEITFEQTSHDTTMREREKLEAQHHRDSSELRRLCQARDAQRDGRLAALERAAKAEARIAELEAQRVPDGYVLMPSTLTAENGAKHGLIGEFSETTSCRCPEGCDEGFPDDDEPCDICDGKGEISVETPISWTTIKAIYAKAVDLFSAAPAPSAPAEAKEKAARDALLYGQGFYTVGAEGATHIDLHDVQVAPAEVEGDFTAWWKAPEQSELRTSCAQGWAEYVWQARAQLGAVPETPVAEVVELSSGMRVGIPFGYGEWVVGTKLYDRPALTATGGRDEYVRGVKAMATEAKQLCRDFSDLRDRPYMGDVTAAIDALAEQVAAAQPAPSQGEDA